MSAAFYKLPHDLAQDIDAYERDVQRFMTGELPAPILKAKRVPRGVYEQRRNGAFMVRVRVAGGALTDAQTQRLAELGREFGDGLLHVTTRQDVQLHDIAIQNTPAIMRRLAEVGLTSKGGGGNTVRNITACPYAGVCRRECFDVTPFTHAVTEYLIPLVGSYNLPRKYKISFSGCAADCAMAQAMDLGFVATIRDGQPGFRVFAGGGMGAWSRIADPLLDWTPASEAIRVAEAVRRLFDQLGDRSNKHRARLRFVFDRLGADAVRARFKQEMARVVEDGVPEWQGCAVVNPERADGGAAGPVLASTREGIRYLSQRQDGFVTVPLHLPLGFVPAADLACIGELAARFSGDRGLRTTRRQNLLIRFVRAGDLPALAAELRRLKTDVLTPAALERFVACAGASTCRLGLALARNAARAAAEQLERSGLSPATLESLDIHINGCANACGQQPIAPIGLFGTAQRVGGRLVPAYRVTLGGRCGPDGARLGAAVGQVPAMRLADFLVALAADFERRRTNGEAFSAFFDRLGMAHFDGLAKRYADVPSYDERPDFYRDLGADEDFSLAGRGAGECGAGVFEVILEDLAAAAKAMEPFAKLLPTARALLITCGIDSQDADTIFRQFEKHFIDAGLVSEEFRPLLTRARAYTQGWQAALHGSDADATRLLDRVKLLYSTLDANLEFHPPAAGGRTPIASTVAAAAAESRQENPPPGRTTTPTTIGAEIDLHGVACPMNFVKAKLRLESLAVGETLAIILDEGEPIANVPASFRNEGQDVATTEDLGDGRWRVVVRKRK